MSGFTLVFDQAAGLTAQDPAFMDLLEFTTTYKYLDKPEQFATGTNCVAAKFDSASTLHQGIVWDKTTDSWLIAAGTVIDNANIRPDGNLQQLLADYLAWGTEVLERLDGHFALAIYDGRDSSLAIVSDPFGFVSLFYAQQGTRLFVSTSALAVARAVQSKPSEFGMRYFIAYGHQVGEMTLWQDVKRMAPATVLNVTPDTVKKYPYWYFKPNPTAANLSSDETVAYIVDSLTQTMQRGLTREGKAWLSLTGGFDTRALAIMMHYSGLSFKSYFHGQPDANDVRLASLISQIMGWEYEYFSLPEDWGCQRLQWLSCALGHCDAHQNILKMSRIVREQTLKAQQYPVSFWGYGGETFRGYYWKQEFFNAGKTSKVNYDRLLDFRIIPLSWPILKDHARWVVKMREEIKSQLMSIGEQEPAWPNTLKLDLIGQYLEHTLSGATISTVMGLQRAIAPLDFKGVVSDVLSTNYKWRLHSRLFRLMFEQVNPVLANIETADGGPALPMRPTNFYHFIPYWRDTGEKLIWGMGRKFLGKSLWQKRDGGPQGQAYPIAQWRKDTLAHLDGEIDLTPNKMRSSVLYNADKLQELITAAQTDRFSQEGLLGRVLTLEMALETVGTSF